MNGPGPGWNYAETAFLRSAKKCCFFLAKKAFYPKKKHPKFLKRLIFVLEKGTFFFEQLFPVVARTWLPLTCVRFFGPEISVFGVKIRILPYYPKFGQRPVCSPWRDRFISLFPYWKYTCEEHETCWGGSICDKYQWPDSSCDNGANAVIGGSLEKYLGEAQ